ncbi:transposase (fragment) [uncultured spirochete]|jgi:transposase|uniref:Transposase n=1 Tax=uncultured spirochete TaxID=156406 RepID=A0A3P3XNG0_9SPIR
MVGKLPIGQKELIWSRVKVMVGEGQLSLKEASITLNVSYRQAKRIVSRYREQGEAGLLHGFQGRRSNHCLGSVLCERVFEAYRTTDTAMQLL